MSSPIQLSLGVSLKDDATFENFFVSGDVNSVAVQALKKFSLDAGDQNLVIWGGRGAGLTHLLQACSHEAFQQGGDVQYLPFRDIIGYSPQDICDSLARVKLVCLDGVDEICGNKEWEQSLFHLYNRLRDQGSRLLLASHSSPPLLPILLADLKSRILGSVVYHIESLSDDAKAEALQMRANVRGMEMADEVARYILNRAPRDMNELFYLLNRLDDASLQLQRKLSIPFVKEVLRW